MSLVPATPPQDGKNFIDFLEQIKHLSGLFSQDDLMSWRFVSKFVDRELRRRFGQSPAFEDLFVTKGRFHDFCKGKVRIRKWDQLGLLLNAPNSLRDKVSQVTIDSVSLLLPSESLREGVRTLLKAYPHLEFIKQMNGSAVFENLVMIFREGNTELFEEFPSIIWELTFGSLMINKLPAEYDAKIQSLDVNGDGIEDGTRIFPCLKKLELNLKLKHSFMENVEVSGLKEISLTRGTQKDQAFVTNLLTKGTALRKVEISCFEIFSKKSFDALAISAAQLKSFTFYSKDYSLEGMSDFLRKRGGQLKSLRITVLGSFPEEILEAVGKYCNQLKEAEFSEQGFVDKYICYKNPIIQRLKAKGVNVRYLNPSHSLLF